MKKQSAMLAVLLLTACCVGPPQPQPDQSPRPTPAPPPPPAPVPVSNDWRDWPMTPGDWRYAAMATGGTSRYGVAGQPPSLTLRCDLASRTIVVARATTGSVSKSMTIQTSSGATAIAATQAAPGAPAEARLPAASPLLDQMAFSRGRFVLTIAGTDRLVAPAWPEVARVIEDCR